MMPPGGGFVLPRLDGILKSYPALANEATAAEVGCTLIQTGIAEPERWALAKGSATEFVRLTLDDWLDRHGRAKVERNFYLDVALTDHADPQRLGRLIEACGVVDDRLVDAGRVVGVAAGDDAQ